MRKVWDEDEDFRLWVLLRRTRDAIHKSRLKELRQAGISVMEAAVLFNAKVLGNRATPAEISRCLFREPHAISELVGRMEKKGLVRRIKDLDRKNLVRVELTKKGEQARKHAAKRNVIHCIMSSLSEEDRRQLYSCLDKLRNRSLKELGIDSKPSWP